MAINTLSVDQAATILNATVAQAKGASMSTLRSADFATVATTALQVGYDPLMTALTQVLSRTIFTERPYSRMFKGLEADALRYGNHVRKLNVIDGTLEEDDRYKLTDGQAIDQYVVHKPKVVQTNFYGSQAWQKSVTVYRDQIDVALSGPGEFARFVTMIMSNIENQLEQAREGAARLTLLNLIGGTAHGTSAQTVDLVSAYNTFTGGSYTKAQLLTPANFPDFARFCFGQIKTVSQALRHRTTLYHVNPTANASGPSGEISRHTPVEDQRLILFGPLFNSIDAQVLSITFNDEYLRLLDHEFVDFWQCPSDPTQIAVNASAMTDTGAISSSDFESTNVLGVLFDREAAGYTLQEQWSSPTPFNARGGYTNIWWHEQARYWTDSTENAVIFKLGADE